MTRELAWKPRWAVIMLVNVCARSTLDISTAPAVMVPAPPPPGWLTVGVPEFADVIHRLPPWRSRPAAFGNAATVRRLGVTGVFVAGSMYDTPPDFSIAMPVA